MNENAANVLILGSAPNATVPEAGYVYCANASGYYYADRLTNRSRITCVVGAHIIAATESSGAPDALKQLRSHVLEAPCQACFLLEHNPWFDGWSLEDGLIDLLQRHGDSTTRVTDDDRTALLQETTGLSLPIFARSLLEEAFSLRDYIRIAKLYIKAHGSKAKQRETNPVLRPSTGVWAAILATKIHGPTAKYTISGISLARKAQRLPHPSGIIPGKQEGFTHHLHADRIVLQALKQRYSIEVLQPGVL